MTKTGYVDIYEIASTLEWSIDINDLTQNDCVHVVLFCHHRVE